MGSDDNLQYERIAFADTNFTEFFGLGVPESAFTDPLAMVLTQSAADRYFATGDAVGKTLTLAGQADYRVVAVIPDLPRKSHLVLSFIAPFSERLRQAADNETTSGNTFTYVRMLPGQATEPLQPLISQMIDARVDHIFDGKPASESRSTIFVPVQNIYLKAPGGVAFKPGGNINIVIGFASIAALILVIAALNYINLSTAKATTRRREVGLRKTHGAERGHLVRQFLGESFAVTMIALVGAIVLAEIALPTFNAALGRELSIAGLSDPVLLAGLAGLGVVVALAAGAYPAFFMASFQPLEALKGEQTGGARWSRLRQALVFIQFAVTIALVAASVVVVRQTIYANNFDGGYAKEGVILLRSLQQNDLISQIPTINQELAKVPGVSDVTASQFVPTDFNEWNTFMYLEAASESPFLINILSQEPNFTELYRIPTMYGRSLDAERGGDQILVLPQEEGQMEPVNGLLNQTAISQLGFASGADALGREIVWDWGGGRGLRLTIVGVVADVHIRSVREEVRPMLYFSAPEFYSTITLSYRTDDMTAFLSGLTDAWLNVVPGVPLDYQILEDNLEALYQSENRQSRVFVAFAVLAIIIATVGLLGLATFAAERRTKEIGIRKVLGASTFDLVRLMVGQFSRPIVLSNIVALPLAWFLMQDWLEGFVYRVDLGLGWFAASGLFALAIAWLTVSSHSFRVARANPVGALRYE